MTDDDIRPSPEALLKEAKSERRGKLKIFLGAAPGVGKTYAMLGAAKLRLADHVDIVLGVVETHQRNETEAVAKGFEAVPKQRLLYRGLTFDEMDLDAVLKRKPDLVLVDELAHTNIPGARHTKRYQDVQELLDAGIDVYATLNVQHIESLNDIVTRITGVKVRETVPDDVVQMANAIELIDLPPDELLQRLKEGKVYIPEQARLAVNRFFTPGNLTALRELALRQAAERVDDQMAYYMRRHAITGPWPTSSRVMVCISGDNQAAALVRTARRNAERRQAPWLILYVETSHHEHLSERTRNDIAQAMELGESMGAETMTVTGEDIAEEILHVARERNVSTIILGKSVRPEWALLFRPSVASTVLNEGDGFDILLVSHSEAIKRGPEQAPDIVRTSGTSERKSWEFNWRSFGKTGFIVAFSTLVALIAEPFVTPIFLPFIFVIAVLLAAVDLNLIGSLLTTFALGLVQYLLMAKPDDPFLLNHTEQTTSLLFFVVVGVGISLIGDRVNCQIRATRRNSERIQSLYDFTKSIAAAATIDDVAQATVRRVAMTLGARVAVLLPRHERLEVAAAVPADLKLDMASNAAMDWAWRHHKPAGFKSDTLPGATFYGVPVTSGTETLGVLAIQIEDGSALTSAQNHFLSSLVYQAASSIERAKLVTDIAQARLQTETERLHTSLLSSISRDLRDPLDSIITTSNELSSEWNEITPDKRFSLVTHIERESDRLDRFVENLLDMTELVTGSVHYKREPTNLCEVIQKAMHRLSRKLSEREVQFDCPQSLPLIEADADILRRVFVNVIENACSFSLPDQPIKIAVHHERNSIKVTITDRGLGIPESERQRVFDMFYRIKKSAAAATSGTSGAGLGLSICRGFITGHQGHISAHAGEGGVGTSIVIRLPLNK